MNPPLKKLAIFVYSLGGGGAEKAALELAVGLQNDYEISLVLFSDVVKYDLPSRLSYTVLDKFDFYDSPLKKLLKLPFLAYKYASFCRKNRIDISLSMLSRPNLIASLSRFFANPSKIFLSEHSTPSYYYGNSFAERILKSMIKFLYPKADKVIAVSSGVKLDLTSNFGVEMQKIVVLYNPVDIKNISTLSSDIINLNLEGFTFITCGRLIPSKNVELLIKAFATANIKNSRLVLLGEGECKNDLMQLCKSHGVADSIDFVGFTQNPYSYMSKSNCFVFGSNLEALPTVLIEALACSLPIISTDCPSGPNEILCGDGFVFENGLKHAEYGLLVEMNNVNAFSHAMKQIATDDHLRQKYIDSSAKRAGDFEKNRIFDAYRAQL